MNLIGNRMFEAVLDTLETSQSVKTLLDAVTTRRLINAYGLDETAAYAVLTLVCRRSGRQTVLVCENDFAAQRAVEDLTALGVGARMLPAREVSFLRADAASRELTLQRLTALGDYASGKISVLVVTADGMMNRCMPRDKYIEGIIRVNKSDIIEPEKLLKKIVAAGYERVDVVEARGQCSLRGGILDVFAIGMANALRIEFFDDEIDSMRDFDVLTQRSMNNLEEAIIYPASEVLLNDTDRKELADKLELIINEGSDTRQDRQRSLEAEYGLLPFEQFFELAGDKDTAEELDELPSMFDLQAADIQKPLPVKRTMAQKDATAFEKRFLSLIDALRNGRFIDSPESLINLFYPDSMSVFEYDPDAVTVLMHADRIKERCSNVYSDFLLSYSAAFERGEALKEQGELLLTYDALEIDMKRHTMVLMDTFLRTNPDFRPDALVKFEMLGTGGFGGNAHELAFEIKRQTQNGNTVVLLSGGVARGQRLSKTLFEEELIAPFTENAPDKLLAGQAIILPVNLNAGFSIPEIGFVLYAEDEIFGRGKQKKRPITKTGDKMALFTELKPGDFVVHESHGIGQYLGTVRLNVDGTLRDFLNIRYAGTDKLYVPTDQMDRIQKYIGSEGEAPKLNKLSGGEWQKQKSRVKRAIKEIACDLIKLYAERSSAPGFAFSPDTPWQRDFEDAFPFEETPDQMTAIEEIKRDMEQPRVMDRLLCGDVGYGKTEVALRAVFKCVMDGKQAVLLAPTTILVQQHYSTALNRFKDFPIKIDTLSRFKSAAEQKDVIAKLKTGEIDFVIGTHKLLAKEIEYKDLGLLVVDEEQRFGVGHKEAIKQYKKSVDVLTLSATPIPRTLHMSMVGIRDMSVLKTPPEERYPVQTYVVEYSDGLVRDAILRELSRGGQVYVLHNRVQSIEMMYSRLKKLVPEARIAIGHGQMREQQLEDVMMDFYDGKFDVLLCTTIIEAGLDVPRANTLIVYDADRFGLSQLYQLRGRVGRSNRIAYAYLTVNPNKVLSPDAEKRLNAIREFTEFGSGFRVAMRDLEIRGTGTLLGAEQSGHMESVGYDLYIKMIDETVHEMQGTDARLPIQTRVDIRIDAYLPGNYVTSEALRIEMYKKIAEIHDDESQNDVLDELIDRFGDPSKPVMNLIYISRIKSACERLYIDNISLKANTLTMRFANEAGLNVNALVKAVEELNTMKFITRPIVALTFTELKKPVEELVVDCTQALNKLADILDAEGNEKNAK